MKSFFFFISLATALASSAQRIDKTYIDQYLQKADPAFDGRQPKMYIVNNYTCSVDKLDALLKYWTAESMGSIAAFYNNSLCVILITGAIDMKKKCANPFRRISNAVD